MPIWYCNFSWMFKRVNTAPERLSVLYLASRAFLRWVDAVRVRSRKSWIKCARKFFLMMLSFADFRLIVGPAGETLETIREAHRRCAGLVSA